MTEAQLISEIYYLNLELSDLEQELLASTRVEQLLTDLKIAQQHLDMLKKT